MNGLPLRGAGSRSNSIVLVARLFYRKSFRLLANELSKQGVTVHVICQQHDFKKYFRPERNVIIHSLEIDSMLGFRSRLTFNRFVRTEVKKLVNNQAVDVILVEGEGAAGSFLFSGSVKIPTITVVNQRLPDYPFGKWEAPSATSFFLTKFYAFAESFQLLQSDGIVFESASAMQSYSQVIKRFRAMGKVSLIPIGVDKDSFKWQESSIRQKIGVSDDAFLIFAVPGSMTRWKGAPLILSTVPKIIERYPNTYFLLLGKNDDYSTDKASRSVLEQLLSSRYARNVILVSEVPLEQLVQLYAACDLFVHASFFETAANVVLEAMACKRPLIITATGYFRELERLNFGGKVVPIGDRSALEKAIIEFIETAPERREMMGRRNRAIIEEHFTPELWANRMKEICRKMTNKFATT